MRLPDYFHPPTMIFAFLDVSETYEVCKVCRTSWDVTVVTCCEGADGSTSIPRLFMSWLFDAEGPQRAKGDWVIFIRIVEEVFEFGG
jgi:hypothetical protein